MNNDGSGPVVLKIINLRGQHVATLVDEQKNAASYTISFSGKQLPSGVYFLKLDTYNSSRTNKMFLVR